LEDFNDDKVVWSTPRKSTEFRVQARKFRQVVKAVLTDQLFLQKVSKAMDKKNFKLAVCKQKIELVEAKLKRVRRTKRRRVKVDPNTEFANIKTIRTSQRAAGRNPIEDSD